MVLVNAVPGRLRVRSDTLRHRRFAEKIETEVRTMPGVTDVRLNRALSSLVGYHLLRNRGTLLR